MHYRGPQGVARVPRATFAELAESGAVTPETIVFDTSVVTVGAVRAGHWERAAKYTWHGRSFFQP